MILCKNLNRDRIRQEIPLLHGELEDLKRSAVPAEALKLQPRYKKYQAHYATEMATVVLYSMPSL